MVDLLSVSNKGLNSSGISFKQDEKEPKPTKLLYEESKKHPIKTGLEIECDKLKNAFKTYPEKGFEGSKNSNFYEFLTMGTVPYLVGSGMMMAVFNLANRFYDTPDAKNSFKTGKKVALGVAFYGILKTLSKYLIETPVNLKYGIDVNVPYRKKIDELPEERNKDNLVSYEYHKAYESVDFPYWDLFHNNPEFGPDRNSYFEAVGKEMGFDDEDLEYADQKVKPLIREKLIETKGFSSFVSYLWAAVGVGVAMQKPFEDEYIKPLKSVQEKKNMKNYSLLKEKGQDIILRGKDFYNKFKESCKEFVGSDRDFKKFFVNKCKNQFTSPEKIPELRHIAGRALLFCAGATTLLGNFITLTDFNKDKGTRNSSDSIIDEYEEKVVC